MLPTALLLSLITSAQAEPPAFHEDLDEDVISAFEHYEYGRRRWKNGAVTTGVGIGAMAVGGLFIAATADAPANNSAADALTLSGAILFSSGGIAATLVGPWVAIHGAIDTTVGASPYIGPRKAGPIIAASLGVSIAAGGITSLLYASDTNAVISSGLVTAVGYGLVLGCSGSHIRKIRKEMDSRSLSMNDSTSEFRFTVLPTHNGAALVAQF